MTLVKKQIKILFLFSNQYKCFVAQELFITIGVQQSTALLVSCSFTTGTFPYRKPDLPIVIYSTPGIDSVLNFWSVQCRHSFPCLCLKPAILSCILLELL